MENEKEYSYSLSEDEGFSEDVWDCIDEYMNYNDFKFPFELEIYKGEVERIEPKQLLPELIDEVDNQLCDLCGEWSSVWFQKVYSKKNQLQEDFEEWFGKWLKKNHCKIDFHNVGCIKCETWIVRSDDDYEVKK